MTKPPFSELTIAELKLLREIIYAEFLQPGLFFVDNDPALNACVDKVIDRIINAGAPAVANVITTCETCGNGVVCKCAVPRIPLHRSMYQQ